MVTFRDFRERPLRAAYTAAFSAATTPIRWAYKTTLVSRLEWDTLIVLDACRHDSFCSVFRPVPAAYSPGSDTHQWAYRNFVGRRAGDMSDVLLVTASPMLTRGYFEMQRWDFPFRGSVDVWRDGWSDEFNTVLPKQVFDAALRESDSSRIIVHFMQPHAPFLPTGADEAGGVGGVDFRELRSEAIVRRFRTVWDSLEAGQTRVADAKAGYLRNVMVAVKWALRLLQEREGKTIVTSDHGNLFGEYGLFGHPRGLYVPELLRVPLFEMDSKAVGDSPNLLS